MARKAVAQKPPTIAPDRALKALTQQLDGLQKLRGRQYADATTDESQWRHQTQSIIGAAFGDPSPELERFYRACDAGGFYVASSGPQEFQRSFELRIREFDALLRSLIEVLRLQLPEEEIKGVYEPGDQYAFYRDLSSLVATVTMEIFIVDAYLDTQRGFAKFGRFAPTTSLSGSACEGKSRSRADFNQSFEMSDKRETGWWMVQSAANHSPRVELPDHQGKYREFGRFGAIL